MPSFISDGSRKACTEAGAVHALTGEVGAQIRHALRALVLPTRVAGFRALLALVRLRRFLHPHADETADARADAVRRA
jgi:hypothetical protein